MQSKDLDRSLSGENQADKPPRSSNLKMRFALWAACAILASLLALGSARFLIIDKPGHADTILVLAGETNMRLARAVQLATQGYAAHIIMDVPDWTRYYGHSELDLAREWASAQPVPITICPTHGLSTKEEAKVAGACLDAARARTVLIVTSDFHTRRALSILRRQLPGHEFSVAAAYDPTEFGGNWWQKRQWTKTNFYEWTRLLWWELVDRWV